MTTVERQTRKSIAVNSEKICSIFENLCIGDVGVDSWATFIEIETLDSSVDALVNPPDDLDQPLRDLYSLLVVIHEEEDPSKLASVFWDALKLEGPGADEMSDSNCKGLIVTLAQVIFDSGALGLLAAKAYLLLCQVPDAESHSVFRPILFRHILSWLQPSSSMTQQRSRQQSRARTDDEVETSIETLNDSDMTSLLSSLKCFASSISGRTMMTSTGRDMICTLISRIGEHIRSETNADLSQQSYAVLDGLLDQSHRLCFGDESPPLMGLFDGGPKLSCFVTIVGMILRELVPLFTLCSKKTGASVTSIPKDDLTLKQYAQLYVISLIDRVPELTSKKRLCSMYVVCMYSNAQI